MKIFLATTILLGCVTAALATATEMATCQMLADRIALFERKTAIIPPQIVGVWAVDKSVLKGPYLYEGYAIYLGADGKGALIVGPPAIGVRLNAVFDVKTNTIAFETIDPDRQNQRGTLKYDPKSRTLVVAFDRAPVQERRLLRRRFDKFTDETRKNLGM